MIIIVIIIIISVVVVIIFVVAVVMLLLLLLTGAVRGGGGTWTHLWPQPGPPIKTGLEPSLVKFQFPSLDIISEKLCMVVN